MSERRLHGSARIVTWSAQILVAVILVIAIPGKFLGDPTAVSIFQQLGAEPVGRLATGVFETLAVILVLLPATAALGALFAAGLMTGAILSHVLVLGISIDGDPSMFGMALVAWLASLTVAWVRRGVVRAWAEESRSRHRRPRDRYRRSEAS